jgi:hypothetical protein
MENKNTTIVIESEKKFAITINNCYEEKLIAVPGSARRMKIQDPADVQSFDFGVKKVLSLVGDKYQDTFYRGTIRSLSDKTFFEDPYDKTVKDPRKALNVHFKEFTLGDVVPIEYMLWRFVHKYVVQIMEGILVFTVDENNYHIFQWLLQALYNDINGRYNKLPKNFIERLYRCFKGASVKMLKIPDSVIDSTVGIYDAKLANKEFFEKEIKAREAEIEKMRLSLGSIMDKVMTPAEVEALPETRTVEAGAETVPAKRGRPKLNDTN